MYTLVLIEKAEARKRVLFALESLLNIQATEAADASDAIRFLKEQGPNAARVIITENLESYDPLLWYIKAERPEITCFILETDRSRSKSENKNNLQQIHFINPTQLVDNLMKALQGSGAIVNNEQKQSSRFCKLGTELLLTLQPLQTDIYIQLSPHKYLRLFKAGDSFDQKDYEKYFVKKGIHYLYVKAEESAEIVGRFKDYLIQLYNDPHLSAKDIDKTSEGVYETVHELIKEIGPTEAIQAVVTNATRFIVKSIMKNPRLKSLLSSLKNKKDSYISSHSMLLARTACAIAYALGWESESTYQKLTLAAFLHDITLQNQKLATFQSLAELETHANDFSAAEVNAFQVHPQQGALLAKEFKEIPSDVDNIVAQHHEAPDGSGFPRGATAIRIQPLSSLFIVAHDLVHFIYEKGDKATLTDFVKMHESKYNAGNFKKILKVLDKLDIVT